MLKIGKKVGFGVSNRLDDVAIIQYMLRRLPSIVNGRFYYKGPVDGFYSRGNFVQAIRGFYLDANKHLVINMTSAEKKEFHSNAFRFTPTGSFFKWLLDLTSDDPFVKNGAVIPGTPILYMPIKRKVSSSTQGDFLIPGTLPIPKHVKIGDKSFATSIEAVSLDASDRFRVELFIGGIQQVIDPISLKLQEPRNSWQFVKHLSKTFQASAWSVAEKPHLKVSANTVDIRTRQSSGLSETHWKIIQSDFFPRVLGRNPEATKGVRIPSRQQIDRIAADIYTAACAGPNFGPKGVSIDTRVQQLIKSVVKKAPTISTGFIEKLCQSCEKIAEENHQAWTHVGDLQDILWVPDMAKDVKKLEESLLVIDLATRDTSAVIAGLDAAAPFSKRLLLPLSLLSPKIPLAVDFDDLVNDGVDFDAGDALDVTEFVSETAAPRVRSKTAANNLRRIASVARLAGRLLWVAEIAIAIKDILEDRRSIGEQTQDASNAVYFRLTGDFYEAQEFMRKRGFKLILELQNIGLELEAQRVILEANAHAMDQMKCPQTYYAPKSLGGR